MTDKAALDAIRQEAWHRGNLKWKLDENQVRAYNFFKSFSGGSVYYNKPRRIGGSYMLLVMAVEDCLRKENAQVKYAAPTAKAVRKIITPNLRKILKDCPKELKPKWNNLEGEWQFTNGSTLSIAGCDNQQFENLRGTEADSIYLDEVGFISDLDYILSDVLMPQVQDTNGLIVLTSTPARSPSHDSVAIAFEHKAGGRFWTNTVWDNPRRTRKQHEDFFRKIAQSKNMLLEEFYSSTTFRREYMGEFIADSERTVIPEWDDETEKKLVKELDGPRHKDTYVSVDPGWKDGTAALLGYWDFQNARLVIQGEYLAFRKSVSEVIEGIKAKELEVWGDSHKPYLRVCDGSASQIISEFNRQGLSISPSRRDDKEIQVNSLRELIKRDKLIVSPKCKRLISQLAGTIWNESRTSYERNKEGHGDLLDALVYMARNVSRSRNPVPLGADLPGDLSAWIVTNPDELNRSRFQQSWENIIPRVDFEGELN